MVACGLETQMERAKRQQLQGKSKIFNHPSASLGQATDTKEHKGAVSSFKFPVSSFKNKADSP